MTCVEEVINKYNLKGIVKTTYIVKYLNKPYFLIEIDTTNFIAVLIDTKKELNKGLFNQYDYVLAHNKDGFPETYTWLYYAPEKCLTIEEMHIDFDHHRMCGTVRIPIR